jgi:hypothetical protein
MILMLFVLIHFPFHINQSFSRIKITQDVCKNNCALYCAPRNARLEGSTFQLPFCCSLITCYIHHAFEAVLSQVHFENDTFL